MANPARIESHRWWSLYFLLYLSIPLLYSQHTYYYTHLKHFAIVSLSTVAVIFVLWQVLIRNTPWQLGQAGWFLLGLAGCYILSPLRAPCAFMMPQVYFSALFLIFLAWSFFFSTTAAARSGTLAALLLVGVTAFLTYYYAISTYRPVLYGNRLFSRPFGNPNLAGAWAAFVFAIACTQTLSAWAAGQWRRALLTNLLSLFFLAAIILTHSKGALLAAAGAGLWVVSYLYARTRWLLLLLLLAIVVIAWHWGPRLAHSRSWETRYWIWRGTWNMITASPVYFLFGWGPGQFFCHYPRFQDPRFFTACYSAELTRLPHNYLLELWTAQGLLGVLLFLGLLGCAWQKFRHTWRTAQRNERQQALAAWAGLLALLLQAQFSVAFSYPEIQLLFWIALAMLLAPWPAERRNQVPTPPHDLPGSSLDKPESHSGLAAVAQAAMKTPENPGSTAQNPVGIAPRKVPAKLPAWLTAPQVRYCIAMLLCVPLWWYWRIFAWEPLVFQRAYSRSVKYCGQLADKLRLLANLPRPVFETFYTLKWRDKCGDLCLRAASRYPAKRTWYQQQARAYYQAIMRFTNYGNVPLKLAHIYARQGLATLALHFLQLYAAKNPFAPELWLNWFWACRQGVARATLIHANSYYLMIYGEDGALVWGRALGMLLQGQHAYAQQLLAQVRQWLKQHHDQRALRLRHLLRRVH